VAGLGNFCGSLLSTQKSKNRPKKYLTKTKNKYMIYKEILKSSFGGKRTP